MACENAEQQLARQCVQQAVDDGALPLGDLGKPRVTGVQFLGREESAGQVRLRVSAKFNTRELGVHDQPREIVVYLERRGEQLTCSGANWR